MGTRHLIEVIDENGVKKVSQYGQWDGYPSGQGTKVLFYATHFLADIKKGLKNCRFLDDDEANEIYSLFSDNGWMTIEQGDYLNTAYPTLSRDTGGDILGYVAFSVSVNPVLLVDSSEFVNNDSCEGVYVIDFSTNEFRSMSDDRVVVFPLDNLPDHVFYQNQWGYQDESGASFDPLTSADYPNVTPWVRKFVDADTDE